MIPVLMRWDEDNGSLPAFSPEDSPSLPYGADHNEPNKPAHPTAGKPPV
jgi:hypothetical protein